MGLRASYAWWVLSGALVACGADTGSESGSASTGGASEGPTSGSSTDTGGTGGSSGTGGVDSTGTGEPTTTGTTEASEGSGATSEPAGLSFAVDVWEPLLAPNCNCHDSGTGGLKLGEDAAGAYAALVNVTSDELPEMDRVEPGDPAASYMLHKVKGTHLEVGGSGFQMPYAHPLRPGQQATIEQWIADGALP